MRRSKLFRPPRLLAVFPFSTKLARLAILGALIMLTAPITGLGLGAHAYADDGDVPECLETEKTVVYRAFGYDHIVTLHNTCPAAVRCRLSARDVPPQPVELDPGENKDVLLRRGSPARTFEYRLVCTGG